MAALSETSLERAETIEALLPALLRMLYKTTHDSVLSDLPLAQTRIMRLLYGGTRTVTVLGEELGLTASAVTQMANRLQDAGLVERVEDPIDRRVKHLALTSEARDRMHKRQEKRVARVQSVLERLDPAQQQAIVNALQLFVEAVDEGSVHESLSYVAEMEQAVPPISPYKR